MIQFCQYTLQKMGITNRRFGFSSRRNCSHFCDEFCQHLGASWTQHVNVCGDMSWQPKEGHMNWTCLFCYDESPCFWSLVCLCVVFSTVFLLASLVQRLISYEGFLFPPFLSDVFMIRVGELLWSLVMFVALKWGSVRGRICIHHVRHLIWRQPPMAQPFKFFWSVYPPVN